jgi:hypothetical protein
MISNHEIAKEISELMLDVFHRLDESMKKVRSVCSAEEADVYQKSVGKVVGPIVMNVLSPLYEQNPSLKPPNWNR